MERNAVAFTGRAIGVTVAGLAVTAALLGGCGEPKAVPMDDEFAGNSGQSADSGMTGTGTAEDAGDGEASDGSDGGNGGARRDTGVYADGTYAIKGQYGPVGEDTIDVYLTIADGAVTDVDVVGHPFTTISKAPSGGVRRSRARRGGGQAARRVEGGQGGRCQLDVGRVQRRP